MDLHSDTSRLGTVTKIIAEKGFGFLRDDHDQIEYFFHKSAVIRSNAGRGWGDLREGSSVEFEPQDGGSKGPRAESIRLR